jgi:hypothetical protein
MTSRPGIRLEYASIIPPMDYKGFICEVYSQIAEKFLLICYYSTNPSFGTSMIVLGIITYLRLQSCKNKRKRRKIATERILGVPPSPPVAILSTRVLAALNR